MIRAPQSLAGQLLAYIVSGGFVVGVHSFIYWALARLLHVEPYIANTAGSVLSGLTGFMLHNRWTFGSGARAVGTGTSFLRYIIVSLMCYAMNSFWVWLCVKRLGQSVEISMIPMIFVTPWLAFVLNRYWAFRQQA